MSDTVTVKTTNHEYADFGNLLRIEHCGQLVLTTDQLANFYGCDTRNISDNFKNNESRFEEGNHYFKLTGGELKAFKRYIENFGSQNLQSENFGLPNSYSENFGLPYFQINKFAPSLYLWTKRGAARHSKMLGTDRAWDVFELLEDAYFDIHTGDNTTINNGVNENLLKAQEITKLAAMAKSPKLRDKLVRQAATLITGDDYPNEDDNKNFIEKFIDKFCVRDKSAYIKRREFLNKLRVERPAETTKLSDQSLTTATKNISGIRYNTVHAGGYAFRGIRWKNY